MCIPNQLPLTRHVDGIGHEVGQVCREDDQTALRLGEAPDIGELEHQRDGNADRDTDE